VTLERAEKCGFSPTPAGWVGVTGGPWTGRGGAPGAADKTRSGPPGCECGFVAVARSLLVRSAIVHGIVLACTFRLLVSPWTG
jgi:hypothetical protein